ncbi:hypothetical protein [Aquisphaera insulae]|uniref:hypothetical protein n=1 Tax=Aquisphaera insulae TaxID=2712864 RepID=UPI0013ED168B|nr:hypothetical protein [Aquisphaera insulae]
MGADAFHVCYGLRWEFDATDKAVVDLLERRSDPRQLAARLHRLDLWWGTTSEDGIGFLLVGKLVGRFGWEGERSAQLDDPKAARLADEVRLRLRAAGFTDEPAWLFQFEPDP